MISGLRPMRSASFAALASLIVMSATESSAQERRCLDLGANCDCSETLDTIAPHMTTIQSGPNCGAPYCNDPINSVGDKQCGRTASPPYFFTQNASPSSWTFVNETEMPFGNSVNTVWQSAARNADQGVGRMDKITSSTRRFCTRIYTKFSNDFSGWTSCNSKIMEFVWGNTGQMQISTAFGGSPLAVNADPDFSSADGNNHFPSPNQVTINDCMDDWCRVEMCASGNVLAGSNLSMDMYIATASGSKSGTINDLPFGTAPGGLSFIWPVMFYREAFQGACNGTRQFSHVMQASWNTDAGQTIGPAVEIEGGLGGGGGGTNTNTAPTPPVLLP